MSFLGRDTAGSADAPGGGAPPSTTSGEPAPPDSGSAVTGTPGQYLLTGDKPLHLDELFDRLLTRLRGELMDERERQGRRIGDGRW